MVRVFSRRQLKPAPIAGGSTLLNKSAGNQSVWTCCAQLSCVDARRHSQPDLVFDATLLPSLSATETAVLSLRRSKAAGPDGVTAELLKVSPCPAARHLVALHVKCVLAVREPIEYKGGP